MSLLSLLCVTVFSLTGGAGIFSLGAPGMLPNGMEIVLVRIPGMPVIATSIHVHVGTEYEDARTSGATHLLEHLLFNGTSRMTQAELYTRMDREGLYINAATRSTGTIVIGLSPTDQVGSLLATESAMLFDSTIPPDKFDKERKIVLEEIAQYASYPGAAVSRWIRSRIFPGTPFALPALGTEKSLESLTRDEVYAYYTSHYVPNNCTLYLIGDFEWPDIWDLLKETFGGFEQGSLPGRPLISVPDMSSIAPDTTHLPVMAPKLILAYDSPLPGDDDFAAVHLGGPALAEFLSLHGDSVIQGASMEHIIHPRLSRMLLTVDLVDSVSAADALPVVEALLDSACLYSAVPHRLEGMKREWSGYLLRTLERPHMFTLFFEDLLSSLGWDGMEELEASVSAMDSLTFAGALETWFRDPAPVPFLVLPGSPVDAGSAITPEIDLESRGVEPGTSGDSVREQVPEIPDSLLVPAISRMVVDTTDSGMIICVRQSPGVPVSGLHILFRRRNAREPDERYGSAEILHRLLGSGPARIPVETFEDTIRTMGADIQVTDNPMIPFDDYYYSARWGYIRLSAPRDTFLDAVEILRDALVSPRFDETLVEREKASVKRLLRRRRRMPRHRARILMLGQLLPGSPLARSPLGATDSIDSILIGDLKAFHTGYVVQENMIVTLCTPDDPDSVAATVTELFSVIPSDTDTPKTPAVSPRRGPWFLEDSLGTGQSSVMAILSFHAERRERAAVRVLTEILDSRMSWLIREERGLSYSLGASAGFLGNHGWIIASVGTRPESILETQSCLKRLIAELITVPVKNREELRIAARSLERRQLLRRLTRTGEAMAMGRALLDGDMPRAVEEEMTGYFHLSTPELLKIASRLDRDELGWVVVH